MGPFFKSRRLPLTAIPTDTIIPLHYWDDHQTTRALTFDFTFRFDDIMDVSKIRQSLVRLMEIGDWRKLGARLRMNVKNNQSFHSNKIYRHMLNMDRSRVSLNTISRRNMMRTDPASYILRCSII
jgi:hypothetical protein